MSAFVTSPSLRVLLEEGVGLFARQVAEVGDGDWGRPTPCSEWTCAELADHVVLTAEGARALVLGRAREEERTSDPVLERWSRASSALLAALTPGAVDETWPLPSSSRDSKLLFYACDFAVHSWDLAVARDVEVELPPDWLAFMNEFFRSLPREVLRKPRAFGEPLDTFPGDGPTRQLMAFLGRSTGNRQTGHARRSDL